MGTESKYKFLSDDPVGGPEAGTAQRLADSFTNTLVQASQLQASGSMVTAVYGAWGSGKTSMLHCIAYAAEKSGAATTMLFEPWRYEQDPDLMAPLLTQLLAVTEARLEVKAAKDAARKAGMRLLGRVARAGLRVGAGFLAARVGMDAQDLTKIGKDFAQAYEDSSVTVEKTEAAAFRADFQQLIDLAGAHADYAPERDGALSGWRRCSVVVPTGRRKTSAGRAPFLF